MYIYIVYILYIILYKYVTKIYFLIYIHIILLYTGGTLHAPTTDPLKDIRHIFGRPTLTRTGERAFHLHCVWNFVTVWNLCQQLYESVLSSVLLPWPIDQGVLLVVPIPFWSSSCPAISPNPGCPLYPIIQRPFFMWLHQQDGQHCDPWCVAVMHETMLRQETNTLLRQEPPKH